MNRHPLFMLVGILLAYAPLQAQEPGTWRTDYGEARKEASKQSKPLLVWVTTDNCIYCQKMNAETFTNPAIAKWMQENFILVKVHAKQDPDFVKALRVTMYPTTVIAGQDGKIYAFLAGFIAPDSFRTNGDKALNLMPKPKVDLVAVAPTPTPSPTPKPKPSVTSEVEIPVIDAKPLVPEASLTKLAPPMKNPALIQLEGYLTAKRFASCLEVAETILETSTDPESKIRAKEIMRQIQANPEYLQLATEELDERTSRTYLRLADAQVELGQLNQAAFNYEKILQISPFGETGKIAQGRLLQLRKARLSERESRKE